MNKFKILLMYSGAIDLASSDTGERIEGVSMECYFFGESGEQLEPHVVVDGISGTRRIKSFLAADKINKVKYVPGIYDGTFELTVGSNGKPTLKLVDVDYIAKAEITMKNTVASPSGAGK